MKCINLGICFFFILMLMLRFPWQSVLFICLNVSFELNSIRVRLRQTMKSITRWCIWYSNRRKQISRWRRRRRLRHVSADLKQCDDGGLRAGIVSVSIRLTLNKDCTKWVWFIICRWFIRMNVLLRDYLHSHKSHIWIGSTRKMGLMCKGVVYLTKLVSFLIIRRSFCSTYGKKINEFDSRIK